MIETYRKVNEYNTPLDEAFYSDINKDIQEEINAAIDEIVFIQRLIDPHIATLEDLQRDEMGRVVVDVTSPHKLVNMAYFTQAADHYRKHGCYTLLQPNKHPKSAYYIHWQEEKRRIRDGLVREDGEWITGGLYWYWNYCPIMKTKRVKAGSKRSERVHDFGDVWLGDYLFWHYKDQAEQLGQHVELMKVRGIGNSFKMGSIGPRNALFKPKSETFYVANDMQFLIKDGILTKSWDYLDFLAQNTPFPRLKYIDTKLEKHIGYKDIRTGSLKGMKSGITGISTKDDPDKIRGKRGDIIFEEYGAYPHIKKAWAVCRASVEDGDNVFAQLMAGGTGGCLTGNNKVFTSNGNIKNISDLKPEDGIIGFDIVNKIVSKEDITYWQKPQNKECIKLETNTFRTLECSLDHPIYASNRSDCNEIRVFEWIEAGKLKEGDLVAVAEEVGIFGKDRLWEPRLVGLMIGDGTYGEAQSPRLSNCDKEVIDYVENRFNTKTYESYITKDGKEYKVIHVKGIRDNLRNIGIYGQTNMNKTLPPNIFNCCKEDVCELLGGIFDTDGCVNIMKMKCRPGKMKPNINVTSQSYELLNEIRYLLQKIGVNGVINMHMPVLNKKSRIKDTKEWYTLDITDKKSLINFCENVVLLPEHKRSGQLEIIEYLKTIKTLRRDRGFKYEKIKSIVNTGINPVYNLTADKTHTYLGNGIITHNTVGADFEGAEDMFYYPQSYNIMPLPNVYDRNTNGSGVCGFFWGAYLNRSNCYDSDGNPDVTKALKDLYIELNRIRTSSSDPMALTQRKAEYPVTPQDSMMRIDGTIFPVADIREYLERIMPSLDEFVGPHYIGDLVFNRDGIIEWKPGAFSKPIREFPLKDNKHEGAIEIFERPFIVDGSAQRGRYVAGIDPFDDDSSNTVSLGSILILDLFTDRIVAEYTGRPKFANDFFETCRRLLIYYNASGNYENDKKGLFQYFDRKNCTYLLCDTLQSLKDVEMIRGNLYGNKSKGTNSGRFINARGRRLSADWMLSNAFGEDTEGRTVLNLHKIRSIGLLLEAMKYNANGNFDRISALGMLMLIREDRQKFIDNVMNSEKTRNVGIQFDPYFIKNSHGTLDVKYDYFNMDI